MYNLPQVVDDLYRIIRQQDVDELHFLLFRQIVDNLHNRIVGKLPTILRVHYT